MIEKPVHECWLDVNHRPPDGVATNGVFTEGPQAPYILLCVALRAHVLLYVAECFHILPHFAHISP